MITSPSNPTGTTIAFDTLKSVCDLAKERGAWRIVDETYLDLADREPDGSDVKSVLACDPDAIVCSSFSKFFGMTGWRLGWMVVPECALEAMDDLATNFFLCAHTPTQHAALACFTPETWPCARNVVRSCWSVVALWSTDWLRSVCRWRLSRMARSMRTSTFPAPVLTRGRLRTCVKGSARGVDAGRDFGEATADTHVRLSYAASREALREGLRRIGDFVAELHG